MNTHDAPTMKDVAREANVSLGTVSKVINGIPVGEHYRKRVEAAAKKLGYQVNNYARGLKTNKTYCVALVMPSLRHPFFAALTDELTNCLMRYGYCAVLMITNFDSVTENNCFTLAQQNKIDGIIALSYSPNLDVDDSIPMVTIDRHFSNSIPCISSDNYQGGEVAAQKLIALGCRNLLFLSIGSNLYSEVEKRGFGFDNTCRIANVKHEGFVLSNDDSEDHFFQYLDDHIQDGKLEFDGIFCNTDGLAIRICEFLRSRDIRIPEDVQVIGYDGILDYATGHYICSTIVQPVAEMAETAVRFLLSRDNDPVGANISLPVYFTPSGTTREKTEAQPVVPCN